MRHDLPADEPQVGAQRPARPPDSPGALTEDQLADYGPWFDNHRRLRELITELEALSLAIAENDPRWNR